MEKNQIENNRRATVLFEAEFDPRLRTYVSAIVSGILILSIVGILLLPFWLILGRSYIKRYFDNLSCELTTRALHFKKGIWFQTERSIPLDKIQDLTFREGPILKYWGLSALQIETAGQSVQGMSDMTLRGIVDARNFRQMVLDQRDEITDFNPSRSGNVTSGAISANNFAPLLEEIHETLKRIEKKIEN